MALPVAWRTSLRERVGSVIITDVPPNLVYVARSASETKGRRERTRYESKTCSSLALSSCPILTAKQANGPLKNN